MKQLEFGLASYDKQISIYIIGNNQCNILLHGKLQTEQFYTKIYEYESFHAKDFVQKNE